MERTNAEISLAMNELDKLILLCKDEQVISEAEADRMISRSLEQNVFDLVALVLSRNTQKSIEMYHDLLLSKEEPIAINAILIGQFRLLLQVSILKRHGFSQGSITTALKIHPYRVKLALRTVQKFRRIKILNCCFSFSCSNFASMQLDKNKSDTIVKRLEKTMLQIKKPDYLQLIANNPFFYINNDLLL